jgi:hypothetical protein
MFYSKKGEPTSALWKHSCRNFVPFSKKETFDVDHAPGKLPEAPNAD